MIKYWSHWSQKFFTKHLRGKPEDLSMMTLSETITRVGDFSMWLWCLYLVKALKTNQALRGITLLVLVVYCIHSQRVYNRQDICKRESQSYLLGERKSAEERDCHKEAPTHCLKISCYQTILPPNVVTIIHPPGIKPSTFLLPCQECPRGNEEQKSTTGWWRRHGWSPTDGEGGGRTQPLLPSRWDLVAQWAEIIRGLVSKYFCEKSDRFSQTLLYASFASGHYALGDGDPWVFWFPIKDWSNS